MKKYIVELSSDERTHLNQLVAHGKAEGYKIKHAQILLKADQTKGSPGWKDKRISEAYDCHITTVENVRRRFVEQDFESALGRAKRGPQPHRRKLDGDAEERTPKGSGCYSYTTLPVVPFFSLSIWPSTCLDLGNTERPHE